MSLREEGISLVNGAKPDAPSLIPDLDDAELATLHGMLPADTSLFVAGARFEVAPAGLGPVRTPGHRGLTPRSFFPWAAFSPPPKTVHTRCVLARGPVCAAGGARPPVGWWLSRLKPGS